MAANFWVRKLSAITAINRLLKNNYVSNNPHHPRHLLAPNDLSFDETSNNETYLLVVLDSSTDKEFICETFSSSE
ncbi:MAG: hypothetical protein Q8M30_12050 [Sediminibacterium sp.]|nr:hypothetical protein [Sediminibacterium sp.]